MAHAQADNEIWTKQKPWAHGGGADVNDKMTSEQIMRAAGLDWTVNKRPMSYASGGKTFTVPGKEALVRSDNNGCLSVVGSKWNEVQNAHIVEFFRRMTEGGKGSMAAAGSVRKGRMIWALADIKREFKLPGGDVVKGQLLMVSSHESGRATIAKLMTHRMSCSNQLDGILAGKRGAGHMYRLSHIHEFVVDHAVEAFGDAREQLSEFEKNARMLHKLQLKWEDAIRVLAPVYQPQADITELLADENNWCPSIRSIMECYAGAPGAIEGNAWGLLNGVTYHGNHRAGTAGEGRLASALIGTESVRAGKVMAALVEMAS